MKMKTIILACTAAMLMAPVAAEAASINHRQDHQQLRIIKGVHRGKLTVQETRRLEAGQARIERMKRHARRDGVVTRRERHQIQEAQNRQNRLIRRLKHNHRSYL